MRKVFLLAFVFLILWTFQSAALEIRYLGHSSFSIGFESGFRCILDPFAPETGYSIPANLEADVLLSSHEHFDHFFEGFLGKEVRALVGTKKGGTEWNLFDETIKGVHVFALPSYHDDKEGKLRGKNAIIVLEGENLRLAHLGDIGALPEEKVKAKLKGVDILFVPTGGNYTLPLDQVVALIRDLAPRVVIPMHYRTEVTRDWPIAPLEEFLKKAGKWKMVEKGGSTISIYPEELPAATEIWLLEGSSQE